VIYVCIPSHNESGTIGVLLWKIRKVLGEFGRDYRAVVLDDASTDGSYDVLARYRRTLPVTILRSEERLGHGQAMERLLRHVVQDSAYPKRDCAVVLQGDFTERPEDIVGLVKILEGGADIVAGAAEAHRGRQPRAVRMARRFARVALGGAWGRAPVSDPLSGLRAYRVIVLKKAFRQLAEGESLVQGDGWVANLRLLDALAPHARRMGEAPLEMRYDLQVRPSRFHSWGTLVSLARLRGGGLWRDLGPGTT
jgi:glycosyltransferase involved in cell wall biosynthesis